MEDKICPFMSSTKIKGIDMIKSVTTLSGIVCKKEKCMAWGVIGKKGVKEEDGSLYRYGCKLIEKGRS